MQQTVKMNKHFENDYLNTKKFNDLMIKYKVYTTNVMAKRVSELIKKRKLSIEKISESTGMSKNMVIKYCNEGGRIKQREVELLCRELDCSESYLYGESDIIK